MKVHKMAEIKDYDNQDTSKLIDKTQKKSLADIGFNLPNGDKKQS